MKALKDEIIFNIKGLLKTLDEICGLELKNVQDENLINTFKNIRDVITEGISRINRHVQVLVEVSEWEKLNVSFFGETNAGKSTLLEALTGGDGQSIGEGYKDFTQKIITQAHRNVVLMDMPGIEGREHLVLKSIEEAVNRSHVVFYVIGTNKEPEEHTIRKIKNFLKDNAKVYSVLNVRGKPTAYKYRMELCDKNIATIEERTKHKFSSLLGGNYVSNVVVQAYLALMNSRNLNENRFGNDKIKALEIFENSSTINRFSNLQAINEIIDELSGSIQSEIAISNTYKFLSSIGTVLAKILREKKQFDLFLKDVEQ